MTKNARTDYINKVRKGIEIYAAIEALKDNEHVPIKYGTFGNFKINCIEWNSGGKSYAINEDVLFGRSMSIDLEKSTKTYLYCYTYDLFGNRTTTKLNFEYITLT